MGQAIAGDRGRGAAGLGSARAARRGGRGRGAPGGRGRGQGRGRERGVGRGARVDLARGAARHLPVASALRSPVGSVFGAALGSVFGARPGLLLGSLFGLLLGLLFGLLLGLPLAACSPGSRSPTAGSAASASAATAPAPRPGESPLVASYHVRWQPGDQSLLVEATLRGVAGPLLVVERSMVPYVRELQLAAGDEGAAAWRPLSLAVQPIPAPPCASRCRLRYRFALGEAARDLGDLDWAGMHGSLVEAPPGSWLIAPAMPAAVGPGEPGPRLQFTVETPPGSAFATGVFRAPGGAAGLAPAAPAAPAEAPATWQLSLRDLWTSPYSAFGAMTVHSLAVPGGALQVALSAELGDGTAILPRETILAWVGDGARAVATYWGRFPMPGALVLLASGGGGRVGGGKTLAGGGGTVAMRVGQRATVATLERDWVLVHELAHLGFPSVPRQHLWAQEGIASYVEPFARVRAGLLDERAAWRGLLEGLPSGLPEPGDRGLDFTPTWGRTYWGGALFWFLCDLELRKRSAGKLGLEHALRGILAAGGNNAVHWSLQKTLALGDRATGHDVLTATYEAMKADPHPVDLEALFAQLGARLDGERVIFDDQAPLAKVRQAITFGTDPK